MRGSSKRTRALALAALPALLPIVSCGPKTVVARLATPTAGVATQAPPPPPARSSPTPRPPAPTTTALAASPRVAPSPSSTPPPDTPTRRPTLAPTTPPTAVAPTATSTRVPTATPVETRAEAAAARPAPPAPSTTAPPPSPPPGAPTPPAAPAATPATGSAVSLTGEWDFRAEAGGGVIAGTLRFRPAPEGLAGVYIGLRGYATRLSNLSAAGNRVSFDLVSPTAVWHLEGTVSGDSIAGTFQTAERLIRWTALRKPAP